jgi:SAM-dependent methyltransferase
MSWDERYRKGEHADVSPMPFLRALADVVPPGAQVLDLACGAGRHSVLFAERGCVVTAVDLSAVAIELLRRRHSQVQAVVAAAEEFDMAAESFDLVVVTMFLDRTLFAKIRAAVKPGGRAAMAIPLVDEREGVRPMNAAYLLRAGELAGEFPEPVWIREHSVCTLPDPPSRRIEELVARKRRDY